ncbi:MAG: MarR family transcriptional regulator, partial [Gammaproteobacteria bacterium]
LGLTGSQFAVLMGVAYRQGEEGITVAALSSYVGLAATHVTTEVRRLIGKNLLIKRPHGSDKRSVLISLSASGAEAVHEVLPLVRKVNDALFTGISRKQLEAANAVAQQLLVNSAYALAEIRVNESLRAATER